MPKQALCTYHPDLDRDAWFDPEQFDQVKAVCGHCPLKRVCLEAAVKNKEAYGVWGQTTPFERGHRHNEDGNAASVGAEL